VTADPLAGTVVVVLVGVDGPVDDEPPPARPRTANRPDAMRAMLVAYPARSSNREAPRTYAIRRNPWKTRRSMIMIGEIRDRYRDMAHG